jgi:protein-tyrosine phosphatase
MIQFKPIRFVNMLLKFREIEFQSIICFRDLGRYQAGNGSILAPRKLFRSGGLASMTPRDLIKLKEKIRLKAVIDLRTARDGKEQKQEINLLEIIGAKYYYVPLKLDNKQDREAELTQGFTHMGEIYLYRLQHPEYGRLLVEALEIMAEPANYPLVFHCMAGKDRTGVLAVMILSVLGVSDEDIMEDYSLSGKYMPALYDRMKNDPSTREEIMNLPMYQWEAAPQAMRWFLEAVRREYGSIRDYLKQHGAKEALFKRLERTLLT